MRRSRRGDFLKCICGLAVFGLAFPRKAMDAGYSPSKQNINFTLSDNKEYAVITVKDCIVAEQLALGINEKPVTFTVGNTKTTYKVLITDLKAGNWKVTSPVGIKHLSVTEAAGTLYFESTGGKFRVEKE